MRRFLIVLIISFLTFHLLAQRNLTSSENVFAVDSAIKGKTLTLVTYAYQSVFLDSTFDKKWDETFQAAVDTYKAKLHTKMNKEIGSSEARLTSFFPASPLSNLLTDLLFNFAQQYKKDSSLTMPMNCSLLNFGGIRSSLPQGKITVGDIYKILPFENKVVFIVLKGSELRKVFQRFTEKKNQPYSRLKIDYQNGKPWKILIGGAKIENDSLYGVATVDFIAQGGDEILANIHFEEVIYTPCLLRTVVIEQIKQLTKEGKTIPAIVDDRVSIQIQNPQER